MSVRRQPMKKGMQVPTRIPMPAPPDPPRPTGSRRGIAPFVGAATVVIVAVLVAVAVSGSPSGRSDDGGAPHRAAPDSTIVVLGQPMGSGFRMVIAPRGTDPADGVVVTEEGTGRGVIDLRRSLEHELTNDIALGPRIATVDDHRIAYSVEEGESRSLVLVDFESHRATRLFRASSQALFYSDPSGWLMILDGNDNGESCSRIRPASVAPRLETYTGDAGCGFEPGGAIVALNTDGLRVTATYRSPGARAVTYAAGAGRPTLDGLDHAVVAQMPSADGRSRIEALDSATGRARYTGPIADETRAFGFARTGFFVETNDGDTTSVYAVRGAHGSLVARQPVTSAVVDGHGTVLLVEPGSADDRIVRVRPDGATEQLLSAPELDLRLLPGAAGAVFAWSARTAVYSGFADRGALRKAGDLPVGFSAAYTHPSSSTAVFLTFDEPDFDHGPAAAYSVRAGGTLTQLWDGPGVRVFDMTSDGRRAVLYRDPVNEGFGPTGSQLASASVPDGAEPPDLVTLAKLPYTLGAVALEPDGRVMFTEYRGAPDAETNRVDPVVRSVPITGGAETSPYPGWSLLDLGDTSTALVLVAGDEPSL